MVTLSIDYGNVATAGYVVQDIYSQFFAFPLIVSAQIKPNSAFYSTYHGIVIQSGQSYSSYANSIRTQIGSLGVSLWFLANTSSSTTLLSGWSQDGGTYFVYSIDSYLNVKVLTNGVNYFSPPISSKVWHHAFITWSTTTTFSSMFVLDATSTAQYPGPAVNPSISSLPCLVIGAIFNSFGNIDPTTTFNGYIRRIELFDPTILYSSPTSAYSYITNFAKLFVTSNNRLYNLGTGCNVTITGGSVCSLCDIFTLSCFPTVSPYLRPNGSASCPVQCSQMLRSCDNFGNCSVCQDPLCVSCNSAGCLQCQPNAAVNSQGICACMTDYAYFQSINACQQCSPVCSTCSLPNDPTKCITCQLGLVLNTDSITNVGSCIAACPQGYITSQTGVCLMQCDPSCLTCSAGGDPSKCTSCADKMFLIGVGQGFCQSSCPKNYSLNGTVNQCLPCHPSCATCLLPLNATSCMTCNSSTPYKTGIWNPAIGTCTQNCSTNNSTYVDLDSKICYTNGKCPISKYQNDALQQCLSCDPSCFGCSAPNDPTKCRGCHSSTQFLRLNSAQDSSGSCVTKCGDSDLIDKLRMVCTGEVMSPSEQQQIQTTITTINAITYNIIIKHLIRTAGTFSGMLSSIALSGNLGAVVGLLGPLQMLNLFSMINIPIMPVKLGMFYQGMGILSLNFIPNTVTYFLPDSIVQANDPANQLDDNANYNVDIFLLFFSLFI